MKQKFSTCLVSIIFAASCALGLSACDIFGGQTDSSSAGGNSSNNSNNSFNNSESPSANIPL